jgi:Tfp pilus assembly protein PilF
MIAAALLSLLSCGSHSAQSNTPSENNISVVPFDTTLSYVRAYLLNNNLAKAQAQYEKLQQPQDSAQALLMLAEISALQGDELAAQQAFIKALDMLEIDKQPLPSNVLAFFCKQKKWGALDAYAKKISSNKHNPAAVKAGLTQVGLCFYHNKRWEQAEKWLQQLDVTQQLAPQVYLALAHIAVQRKQYLGAQALINQYEVAKTHINAKNLWNAIEIYVALKEPDIAAQLGQNLRSLFPHNEYTREYIMLVKRSERVDREQLKINALLKLNNAQTKNKPANLAPETVIHTIKKGETLYQLARNYQVSLVQLLAWNPNLVIEEIAIGTQITVAAN